jgi:hypothetical protein
MEVPHTNDPCGYLRRYKSSKETSSSRMSHCKTGKKQPFKMKLLRRRSYSESSRRLRDSAKDRNLS